MQLHSTNLCAAGCCTWAAKAGAGSDHPSGTATPSSRERHGSGAAIVAAAVAAAAAAAAPCAAAAQGAAALQRRAGTARSQPADPPDLQRPFRAASPHRRQLLQHRWLPFHLLPLETILAGPGWALAGAAAVAVVAEAACINAANPFNTLQLKTGRTRCSDIDSICRQHCSIDSASMPCFKLSHHVVQVKGLISIFQEIHQSFARLAETSRKQRLHHSA